MSFRPTLLVSSLLTSFAIAILALPHNAHADKQNRYVDRNHGFSFSVPRFAPSEEIGVTTVAITLSASPSGGFAPNVNVIVQNIKTDLDAFTQLQQRELKSIGWEVVEQSRRQVRGTPTLRTHARGSLQGQQVEFLSVTMIRRGKSVYVLTCTATQDQFPLYQMEFERVISSFVIDGKAH